MTEQPYPQPPVGPRTRPNPWPFIAGIVVLALLAGILAVVLLTRDSDGGTAAGSGTPSPSATASASASGTASPGTSQSASPDDGSGEGQLELLSLVEAVAEGVTLREEPGTGGERIGTLAGGSRNIVVEGPVDADGYQWYRLAAIGLPPSSGCITPLPTDPLACPIWYGWAASGDPEDGTAWFEVTAADCPDPDGATDDFMSLPRRMPLPCYAGGEITFTAWYPEPPASGVGEQDCEPDPSIAWLYCDDAGEDVWPSDSEPAAFVLLFVDPDSSVSLPERGQWLRVTGAHDHPDASACAEANAQVGLHESDDLAVLECRVRLVVSAVEVTSAP